MNISLFPPIYNHTLPQHSLGIHQCKQIQELRLTQQPPPINLLTILQQELQRRENIIHTRRSVVIRWWFNRHPWSHFQQFLVIPLRMSLLLYLSLGIFRQQVNLFQILRTLTLICLLLLFWLVSLVDEWLVTVMDLDAWLVEDLDCCE